MIPRPPSAGETQRAREFLAPRSTLTAKIRRWQPFRNPAGTMIGYLDVELPSGMTINGCKLMRSPNGKPWVAMPSERQVDRDGNPRLDANGKQPWSPIVEFANRDTANKFQQLILDALSRQYPDALALDAP